jgi:hypothetical protein
MMRYLVGGGWVSGRVCVAGGGRWNGEWAAVVMFCVKMGVVLVGDGVELESGGGGGGGGKK